MGPAIWVVYAAATSAAMVWFWPHCAEPMLRGIRAPQLASWIVLAVTLFAIAAQVLRALVVVLDADAALFYGAWIAASFAWIVIVGLGYLSSFDLLARACRAVER